MKLYGGNGNRVSKPGKGGRSVPQDDYYYDEAYDPRYRTQDPRYTAQNGYDDPRYRQSAQQPQRRAPQQTRYAAPPSKPPKKKKSGWKVFGTVLLVLAILVGCAYAYWMITTKAPTKASQSAASPKPTDLNADQSEAVASASDRYYTLLIVGKDVAGLNTDTMMLCRYDSIEHKMNICSLPRDTLVNIKASVKKLNNVYAANNASIDALMDGVKDVAGFFVNRRLFYPPA